MGAIVSGGVRKIGIVAPNRIVRACNRSTGALVEETISDSVGNYTFQNLDTGITYYIYALDETFNQYNASISDIIKSRPLFSFTGTSTGTLKSISLSTATFTLSTTTSIATAIASMVSNITVNISIQSLASNILGAGSSTFSINITNSATGYTLINSSSSISVDITDSATGTIV